MRLLPGDLTGRAIRLAQLARKHCRKCHGTGTYDVGAGIRGTETQLCPCASRNGLEICRLLEGEAERIFNRVATEISKKVPE